MLQRYLNQRRARLSPLTEKFITAYSAGPLNLSSCRRLNSGAILICLIGLGLAFYRYGWFVLNPTDIYWPFWLGDKKMYFATWHFYRYDAWTLILGAMPNYLHPMGNSVGLTDAIPLFAIPFKAISSLLPQEFQYFGIWLFLCFMLQGFFGYKIIALFTPHLLLRLTGGLIFVFLPVFLIRFPHIALSAHWMLLAALYLYLAGTSLSKNFHIYSYAAHWFTLISLSCLTHIYLAFMIWGIWGCAIVYGLFCSRRISLKQAHYLLGGSLILTLLILWQGGYFLSGTDIALRGFERLGSDLLSLFHPRESAWFGNVVNAKSVFIPKLFDSNNNSSEGYAYLGLGMLLLLLVALGVCIWFHLWRSIGKIVLRHWCLTLLVILFFLYSLGGNVEIGGNLIYTHKNLPAFIQFFTTTLRAAGRFIWILYYLIVAGTLFVLIKKLPFRISAMLLLLGLALQVWDTHYMMKKQPQLHANISPSQKAAQNEHYARWHKKLNPYSKIYLFPSFADGTGSQEGQFILDMVYLTAEKRINFGLSGRHNWQEAQGHLNQQWRRITSHDIENDALYLFKMTDFNRFPKRSAFLKRIFVCETIASPPIQNNIYGEPFSVDIQVCRKR